MRTWSEAQLEGPGSGTRNAKTRGGWRDGKLGVGANSALYLCLRHLA